MYEKHFLKDKIKSISDSTPPTPVRTKSTVEVQSYNVFNKQLQNRILAVTQKENRLSKLPWLEIVILADRKNIDLPVETVDFSIINFNIKKSYKKSKIITKLEALELLSLANTKITPIPISLSKEKILKEDIIQNERYEKEPMLTQVIEKENNNLVSTQVTSLPFFGVLKSNDNATTKINISDIDSSLVLFNTLLNKLENGFFQFRIPMEK